MKLSKFKNDYYEFSGLASASARQLAFAGIALLWIFKSGDTAESYVLPAELFLPAVLLIASLGFDLIQYICGSVVWGQFHRYHEGLKDDNESDPDIEAPFYFNWPIQLFFYLKTIFVLLAYWYLLIFAYTAVNFETGT